MKFSCNFLLFCIITLCVSESSTTPQGWQDAYQKYYESKLIDSDVRSRKKRSPAMELIFVGTKWCGDGSIAKNYDDLGMFRLTDMCCRDHDSCFQFIPGNQTAFGLTNNNRFSQSHCSCDFAFYDCLKKNKALISAQIGQIFFNILGPQCFKEEHPATCTKSILNRCVSYEYDTTQPKVNQWFDNKFY